MHPPSPESEEDFPARFRMIDEQGLAEANTLAFHT